MERPADHDAMTRRTHAAAAAETIRSAAGGGYELAVILGSGLGELAGAIQDAVRLPYEALAGFPRPAVSAHAGEIVAGSLYGKRALVFAGREHYYEQGDAAAMAVPVEVAANLDCRTLILTNAAGSLSKKMPPGSLALIRDHINFSGRNPLIGLEGDERFVDMGMAYDPALQKLAAARATTLDIDLQTCVYMWFSGPSFETPAEVRAAGILGADLVGMSTVPETILARYFGMQVLAFSVVTNYAAGLVDESLSHAQTQSVAAEGAKKLLRLLPGLIEDIPT